MRYPTGYGGFQPTEDVKDSILQLLSRDDPWTITAIFVAVSSFPGLYQDHSSNTRDVSGSKVDASRIFPY